MSGIVCSWLTRNSPLINTLVLVVAVWSLWVAIDQREYARVLGAWNVIAISPQARGNIGQKEAVEFLFRRGDDLRSINLRQAHLLEVQLPGADLWNAKLEGAFLERANLKGAKLVVAKLRGADLRGSDLTNAHLHCAFLSPGPAADASGIRFPGADLKGAILKGTEFDGADLRMVDFTGANVSGASFRDFACDVGVRRRALIERRQLERACADPNLPPKLPKIENFDGLKIPACPKD